MAKTSERKLAALPHHEQGKEREHASGQSVGGHGGRILAARAGSTPAKFKELNSLSLSVPKLFGRDVRAFGHRLKLRPGDLGIAHARSETTVRTGHDVFTPDDFRIAHQAVGDCLRVLHDIRRMPDDPWDEHLSGGELHFVPDAPFVLVT